MLRILNINTPHPPHAFLAASHVAACTTCCSLLCNNRAMARWRLAATHTTHTAHPKTTWLPQTRPNALNALIGVPSPLFAPFTASLGTALRRGQATHAPSPAITRCSRTLPRHWALLYGCSPCRCAAVACAIRGCAADSLLSMHDMSASTHSSRTRHATSLALNVSLGADRTRILHHACLRCYRRCTHNRTERSTRASHAAEQFRTYGKIAALQEDPAPKENMAVMVRQPDPGLCLAPLAHAPQLPPCRRLPAHLASWRTLRWLQATF